MRNVLAVLLVIAVVFGATLGLGATGTASLLWDQEEAALGFSAAVQPPVEPETHPGLIPGPAVSTDRPNRTANGILTPPADPWNETGDRTGNGAMEVDDNRTVESGGNGTAEPASNGTVGSLTDGPAGVEAPTGPSNGPAANETANPTDDSPDRTETATPSSEDESPAAPGPTTTPDREHPAETGADGTAPDGTGTGIDEAETDGTEATDTAEPETAPAPADPSEPSTAPETTPADEQAPAGEQTSTSEATTPAASDSDPAGEADSTDDEATA